MYVVYVHEEGAPGVVMQFNDAWVRSSTISD